ncbi:MAG: hypothetical protein JST59_15620 [Actinobacteria bacterium]|nr:hypothetical protein [Actinomycetota bacterium]
MSGVLHYRALDRRGDEILDELEERFQTMSNRLEDGERSYFVRAAGEVDLDPNLEAVDPTWAEHIQRLTAR